MIVVTIANPETSLSVRATAVWETNATAPFLTIGNVGVEALGGDRFVVSSPHGEQMVEGFEAARQLAHALADRPSVEL